MATLDVIKKKDLKALEKHASDLRVQIVNKTKAIAAAEETNHQSSRKLKRELAQTLTVLNQKKAQEK